MARAGYFEVIDQGGGEYLARVYKFKQVPDSEGRPQCLNDGPPEEFTGTQAECEKWAKARLAKLEKEA